MDTGHLAPKDSLSDAELVDVANRGDAQAFETLYERHRKWLMAVAIRLTGDHDIAADVVQDAVLYWLGRFPGFVLTGSARSYLYPLLRHHAIDRVRRAGRGGPHLAFDEAMCASPSSSPAGPEHAAELHRELARLPLGQREVILLHFGDGLTLAEVALALGVPIGTVKSRLGLALASLRANDRLRDRYFTA
jgi:RNA polymerase sigma factor (sigma-70 family)